MSRGQRAPPCPEGKEGWHFYGRCVADSMGPLSPASSGVTCQMTLNGVSFRHNELYVDVTSPHSPPSAKYRLTIDASADDQNHMQILRGALERVKGHSASNAHGCGICRAMQICI